MAFLKKVLGILFWFLCTLVYGQGEYFGQNKTRNRSNEFEILRSSHFDLYYYLQNKEFLESYLSNAEQWYKDHQSLFKMAFIEPNPLILYNAHPDFQETTIINGILNEGTGGVTEGFKTRVVMPIFFTKKQTNHVLGHELVHVFQYQTMTFGSDSTTLQNMAQIPLFMTEGLAEYLSLGRNDPHTSLWMRDAVVNRHIPTIEDLVLKQHIYFPYRWGQAFWAYVTALYGDEIIRPLYKQVAIYGLKEAFVRVFRMDLDTFSEKFKNDLIQYYTYFEPHRSKNLEGRLLASSKTGGKMNISPALSPDGKYLAYISSKDVLSMNLFIADAQTGKILKKINTDGLGAHVDSYSFIETSVTWSPNSQEIALVIQSKAKNKLLIISPFTGAKREIAFKQLDAFTHPAWSPNGEEIVFSGLKDGVSDLYLYHFKTKKLSNLTQDEYSDVQACWSPNGLEIYFVSDRGGSNNRLEKEPLKIAKYTLATGQITVLPLFQGVDVYNPQVTQDGVYFISSPDGFRDIYHYHPFEEKITRISNYFSGVTGVTAYSPAITAAYKTGDIAFNILDKGNYQIVSLKQTELLDKHYEVSTKDTGAGILPPGRITRGEDIVQKQLQSVTFSNGIKTIPFKPQPYKSNFKLDYIANSGISMGASRFGAGMAGGVIGIFSDMLNNNQLAATVAVNGEFEDVGGQIYYLNQKNKWQFGFSGGHIPYRMYGGYNLITSDSLFHHGGLNYYEGELKERIVRVFMEQVSGFLIRPISRQVRIEFGASVNAYRFSGRDYPRWGKVGLLPNGTLADFITEYTPKPGKVDREELGYTNFASVQLYSALVGDNTTFGTVAPLNGYRYRLEIAKHFGSTDYNYFLGDIRKYYYVKPFSVAGRFYYEGRLRPKNLENLSRIYPLYLGYPWYIHGLDKTLFIGGWNQIGENNPLSGEQMMVSNLELRLPFTGNKTLALIPFNYVASDINLFVDAGTTWSTYSNPLPEKVKNSVRKNQSVVSIGASWRVNLLGYLMLEPYLAIPYRNGNWQGKTFGINFMVGGW